jgi:ferric-dicitrate binding protein FerR (iron transport regulator)
MTGSFRSRTAQLSLLAAMTAAACVADVGSWFTGSAEQAATAKVVAGRVSVLRDLREFPIVVNDQVKVQETIVTGRDGHAIFQVSDGSTFEVYPNAKVVFRKNAGNWRDLLDVMLGRVRVHIEHLGGQPNPHRVLTPTAVISVRGTTFDIDVNDDDESTLVIVEEGIVDVRHALLGSDVRRQLRAGESLRVYRDEPIARRWDKGGVMKQGLRVALEAVAIVTRPGGPSGLGKIGGTGGLGGGIGGGVSGVGGVGDTDPGGAPPPIAPPPPPPAGGLPPLP